MRPRTFAALLVVCVTGWLARAADERPEALLLIISDLHSAYDKVGPFVAQLDELKARHRDVPIAVLINGDSFEYGNVIARRSGGEIDLAFFAALARRVPVVLNLGNHEPDFHNPIEAVAKIRATGVTVISGNGRDRASNQPLAAPSTKLKLGSHEATIVGVLTDRLDTFRAAIRPDMDLANPAIWAREHFPALLTGVDLPIVMSHSGIRADREILPHVPNGALFIGAHDHLLFAHPFRRQISYAHAGSWMEYYLVAALRRMVNGDLRWQVNPVRLDASGGDIALGNLVQRVRQQHLTPEDTVIVGRLPRALPLREAAPRVATWLREAAGVDTAFIGNTTFGAGLPAGEITQLDFNACVRFDGPIFTASISGARLHELVAQANEDGDTPFEARNGEFSFAGGTLRGIDLAKTYTIATTDWGAKNTNRYFGDPSITWQQHPTLRLKAAALAGLAKE